MNRESLNEAKTSVPIPRKRKSTEVLEEPVGSKQKLTVFSNKFKTGRGEVIAVEDTKIEAMQSKMLADDLEKQKSASPPAEMANSSLAVQIDGERDLSAGELADIAAAFLEDGEWNP